jgi:hypothetical protein
LEAPALPAAVTEDSTDDTVAAIGKQSYAKKVAKKSAPKSKSSKQKPQQPFKIVRTPIRAANRSGITAKSIHTPEQRPSASATSAGRKRLIREFETEAEAGLLDVRQVLPSSSLQSPSKKLKDECPVLPPLLGREPWFPQDEEEIVLQSETEAAESSAAADDVATAEEKRC